MISISQRFIKYRYWIAVFSQSEISSFKICVSMVYVLCSVLQQFLSLISMELAVSVFSIKSCATDQCKIKMSLNFLFTLCISSAPKIPLNTGRPSIRSFKFLVIVDNIAYFFTFTAILWRKKTSRTENTVLKHRYHLLCFAIWNFRFQKLM